MCQEIKIKTCNKCNISKPISNFNKLQNAKDSVDYTCKLCAIAKRKIRKEILIQKRLINPVFTTEKLCTKCNNILQINDFGKCSKTKDGFKEVCKPCRNVLYKQHYNKNKSVINLKRKIYSIKNKNKIKKYHQQWYINNKEHIIKGGNLYRNTRLKTDVNYKLLQYARTSVYLATNGRKGKERTIDLLGCTIEEYKRHLESHFKLGMTWENRGRKVGCWQVDHRIPLSFFKLNDVTEKKQAFNYTNCQPLWFEENMNKRDNIIPEYANFFLPTY